MFGSCRALLEDLGYLFVGLISLLHFWPKTTESQAFEMDNGGFVFFEFGRDALALPGYFRWKMHNFFRSLCPGLRGFVDTMGPFGNT